MKKTFAQLKRDLQVGTKIKCIANYCRDDFEKEVRVVSHKQSNAITLKTFRNGSWVDSWLYYPNSATLVEYEDNTFTFYHKHSRTNEITKLYTYEIIGA